MSIRITRTRPEGSYLEVRLTRNHRNEPIVYVSRGGLGPLILLALTAPGLDGAVLVRSAEIAHALRKFESVTVYVPPEITLCN